MKIIKKCVYLNNNFNNNKAINTNSNSLLNGLPILNKDKICKIIFLI